MPVMNNPKISNQIQCLKHFETHPAVCELQNRQVGRGGVDRASSSDARGPKFEPVHSISKYQFFIQNKVAALWSQVCGAYHVLGVTRVSKQKKELQNHGCHFSLGITLNSAHPNSIHDGEQPLPIHRFKYKYMRVIKPVELCFVYFSQVICAAGKQ